MKITSQELLKSMQWKGENKTIGEEALGRGQAESKRKVYFEGTSGFRLHVTGGRSRLLLLPISRLRRKAKKKNLPFQKRSQKKLATQMRDRNYLLIFLAGDLTQSQC